MALLISPGLRVCDADGVPINGAKVRVRVVNTLTAASLYSDAALSSSISNPVTTNAAGYPSSNGTTACGIFVQSGTYDVAFVEGMCTYLFIS